MAKIYTKTGDLGKTGLWGGKRVLKSDIQIDSYGSVDELNSWLGLIATFEYNCIDRELFYQIQSNLFNIGSILAKDPEKEMELPQVHASDVKILEDQIDVIDSNLPKLMNFILPGGSREVAEIHIARTVCRRAERACVLFGQQIEIDSIIITYLNRLSDYLFILARAAAIESGKGEIPWKPRK